MVVSILDFEAIGKRIGFYRKKKKLTQAELAEQLDVSVSFISKIERGKTHVSLIWLEKIADALDVDYLMFLTDLLEIENGKCDNKLLQVINRWPKKYGDFLMQVVNLADATLDINEED